jgi:hypothetical protein
MWDSPKVELWERLEAARESLGWGQRETGRNAKLKQDTHYARVLTTLKQGGTPELGTFEKIIVAFVDQGISRRWLQHEIGDMREDIDPVEVPTHAWGLFVEELVEEKRPGVARWRTELAQKLIARGMSMENARKVTRSMVAFHEGEDGLPPVETVIDQALSFVVAAEKNKQRGARERIEQPPPSNSREPTER